MLLNVMSFYVILCHVILCQVIMRHVMLVNDADLVLFLKHKLIYYVMVGGLLTEKCLVILCHVKCYAMFY